MTNITAQILPSLYATATFRSQWLHSTDLDAPLDHDVRYVRRSPTADHRGESPARGIVSQSTLADTDPFQVVTSSSGLQSQSHMADVVQRLGIAGWYADAGDGVTRSPSFTEDDEPRRLSPIKERPELAEDVYVRMAWLATRASRIPRHVSRSHESSRRTSRIPRPFVTNVSLARLEQRRVHKP